MRKKKFSPEFRSYSTRAGNLKKNSIKIQKIKKTLTDIIFSQKEMRLAEIERKKFYSRIPFILNPGKKIMKKTEKKKTKKLQNHFPAFFLRKRDEILRKGEKKILVSKSVQTQPE